MEKSLLFLHQLNNHCPWLYLIQGKVSFEAKKSSFLIIVKKKISIVKQRPMMDWVDCKSFDIAFKKRKFFFHKSFYQNEVNKEGVKIIHYSVKQCLSSLVRSVTLPSVNNQLFRAIEIPLKRRFCWLEWIDKHTLFLSLYGENFFVSTKQSYVFALIDALRKHKHPRFDSSFFIEGLWLVQERVKF